MAKTYKLTNSQMKMIIESMKSEKNLNEGSDITIPVTSNQELSPEAASYYAQQNKKPKPEEVPEEEEIPVEEDAPIDPNDPAAAISALVNQELQKLGINPGGLKKAAAASSNHDSTSAIKNSAQNRQTINTPANPQPSVTEPTSIMGEELPVSNSIEDESESVESNGGDLFFKTPLENINITNSNSEAIMMVYKSLGIGTVDYITARNFFVTWGIDEFKFLPNDAGIGNMITKIYNVEGTLLVDVFEGGVEDDGSVSKVVNFDAKKMGFRLKSEMSWSGNELSVQDVEIDWQKRLITVT